MENLFSFKSFSESLFESEVSINLLKNRYSISDDEWEALRIIPEEGIPEKFSKYYKLPEAKKLVSKLTEFVCDGIFDDSEKFKDLMLNIAAVESCYGTNPSTYKRPNYTKGMFQLDKTGALTSIGYKDKLPIGNKHIRNYVDKCKKRIKEKIGLDWDKVPYESLSKPLYNAIAARIYIGMKTASYTYDKETNIIKKQEHPISLVKKEQAKWWKERYNTSAGDGTESKFIRGCS